MQTKLDERMEVLEGGIDELKQMKADFDKNNEYFAQLLQRMESQILRREQEKAVKDSGAVNNGALLAVHGMMSTSNKEHDHQVGEASLNVSRARR
jgi:hypothetical protein